MTDVLDVPLEDIHTAIDSRAVADQIAALVRHLTSDPTTRLYCSLAGGRKTQSVLLGFALQLYGRPQDRLLQVLVDEALQNHSDFFYPAKESRLLPTRDGRLIDAHTAQIDVVDMPFLRLREKLSTPTVNAYTEFAPAIVQAQQALDTFVNLPPLTIRVIQFSVVCSIPPFAKGGEGGFASPERPEIPPAPFTKGGEE